MKKHLLCLVMLSAFLGLGNETRAGEITIQTMVRAMAQGPVVIVAVSLTNQGDEAARLVNVSAKGMGVRSEAPVLDSLDPGQTTRIQVRLEPGPTKPGSFPIAVRVNFQDSKGYPFTTLAWVIYSGPKALPAALRIEAPTIDLAEEGLIEANLVPFDDDGVWVRVRVVVPPELEVTPLERLVQTIPPHKTKIEFRLRDRSGRIGTVYPLLVLAEYRKKGVMGAAGANGWARVKAKTPFFKRWSLALGLLAGLIFLTVLLLQKKRL